MIIPIRCFTCNKVIANKWDTYLHHINNGISIKNALDIIGLNRYCCKRMFLSHIDIFNKIIEYSDSDFKSNDL